MTKKRNFSVSVVVLQLSQLFNVVSECLEPSSVSWEQLVAARSSAPLGGLSRCAWPGWSALWPLLAAPVSPGTAALASSSSNLNSNSTFLFCFFLSFQFSYNCNNNINNHLARSVFPKLKTRCRKVSRKEEKWIASLNIIPSSAPLHRSLFAF